MIFSAEATKLLMREALSDMPVGKVVELGLLIQSGSVIKVEWEFVALAGFILKHNGQNYGQVKPEYYDLLVEAVQNRLVEENALKLSLEDIIHRAFSTKAVLLDEILIGLDNNQIKGTLVPDRLIGMFLQSDTDKNSLIVKSQYYSIMKSVVSALYLELNAQSLTLIPTACGDYFCSTFDVEYFESDLNVRHPAKLSVSAHI